MLNSIRKHRFGFLALIFCVIVLAAPIVPSKIFLRYWPLYARAGLEESFLAQSDVRAAIKQLRQQGHYGKGEFRTVPPVISLWNYFFYYERIGMLQVKPRHESQLETEELRTLVAHVGMDCGGWCGGAVIFEITKNNGEWEVSEFGYSVD